MQYSYRKSYKVFTISSFKFSYWSNHFHQIEIFFKSRGGGAGQRVRGPTLTMKFEKSMHKQMWIVLMWVTFYKLCDNILDMLQKQLLMVLKSLL